MDRLARLAPGVPALLHYRFATDFRYDLVAGISVAAVALPVAVAYAELAGFDPVVGLYSSILPLVAYALFGTSRQLMVNPDAATCAMIAAAVAPLAVGDAELYGSLAILLTFFTGLFCIAASFLRLGALADFLSKPILVGFLNGVAISILLGQIGKLFGFAIESGRIIPRLLEFIGKLPQTHGPTLAVGLGSFAVLFLARRFLPRWPSALITLVVAGIAVAVLKLDEQGVAILGPVPAGLPPLRWPTRSPRTFARPGRQRGGPGPGAVFQRRVDRPQLRREEPLRDRRGPGVRRVRRRQHRLRPVPGFRRHRRRLAHRHGAIPPGDAPKSRAWSPPRPSRRSCCS